MRLASCNMKDSGFPIPWRWSFGTVDIFRGSDVGLLHWLQIRSWWERSLPKVNSSLTKTRKTPLCQRQGLRPFAIFGLRAYERHTSYRPPTANGRFSFVESWCWHNGKTLKTGYRDVTSNSQLPSLNAKHRASLFSRFSLLWCKPEERRLFLLRCQLAEACFGASRHRRRNKGCSPCITARGFICFCKRIVFMSSLLQTQGWPCASIHATEKSIVPIIPLFLWRGGTMFLLFWVNAPLRGIKNITEY